MQKFLTIFALVPNSYGDSFERRGLLPELDIQALAILTEKSERSVRRLSWKGAEQDEFGCIAAAIDEVRKHHLGHGRWSGFIHG